MTINLATDARMFGRDFGERVVYHPQGRQARPLEGINVVREGFGAVVGGDGVGPSFSVSVPNDATHGIAREELDQSQDLVELAVRTGGKLTRRRIISVADEDAGMLTLFLE